MHGKAQVSQIQFAEEREADERSAARHVMLPVCGQRAGGQISKFVVNRIGEDGFSAYFEDALQAREHIAFNFVGHGIVMATLQHIYGVEARFQLHSHLSDADIDAILKQANKSTSGFLSASCGVTPTFPARI